MTEEDNIDDVDDGNFDDTLSEILGTSSRVATSPDLVLTFAQDEHTQNIT